MDKIRLRLSFAEMIDPDVAFWTRQLSDCGVEVIASGQTGIDAVGDTAAIERALQTKLICREGKPPVLGEIGVSEGEGRPTPLAYIPREATYF